MTQAAFGKTEGHSANRAYRRGSTASSSAATSSTSTPTPGDQDNLLVPFFTTKPSGSGISLTVARRIAEAHGGTLALQNRSDARGCWARIVLPMKRP
jgi:hypothetical protein